MKRILQLILGISMSTLSAQVQIQMPQPAQSTTFGSNVRGYYFTAPTCFTITGAMIPTDASSEDQSIAIIRFPSVPPMYAVTTNTFDVLYLTQNNPTPGIIGLNIPVNAGDVIGILAQRGTTCSYANSGFVSNINGFPMTLERLGMQYPLTTTAPQELWTESGGSISRMFLYYDTNMLYNLTYTNTGADYTFNDGTDTLYTSLFSVWDYGDGSPLDTNYTPTHTYANGTYNVCSYVHTACGIDTVCTSVTVCSSAPVAGFTANSSGLTANFTSTGPNATTWSWDFGDGNVSASQNPTHTYSTIGTYIITQIVGNTCFPNDTIIDTIVVCTNTSAGFGVVDAESGTANFTNSSVYGMDYVWNFGDSSTDTAANPSHTYAANGIYNVCLISENMCSSDTLCTTLTICPDMPASSFTSVNNVFSATFTNTSTSDASSHWNFGDGNTSNTANPSHTYAAAGNYNVCLTSFNECGDSSVTCNSVTIAGNTGLEETGGPILNVYPNPVSDAAVLNIYSTESSEGKIYITDITGKVVANIYSGAFIQGNASYTIHFSNFSNGIYMLVWETEKWKSSKKIIVN